jgi:hypothetical protein
VVAIDVLAARAGDLKIDIIDIRGIETSVRGGSRSEAARAFGTAFIGALVGRRCVSCGQVGKLFEAISQAADGSNAHAADFYFFAQPMHVYVDRVIADFFAPFA